MKKFKMLKLLGLAFVCSCILLMTVYAEKSGNGSDEETNSNLKYYYEQLRTEEAKKMYETLEYMLAKGDLAKGDVTVDLVEKGVLKNEAYDKDALMADFISARDAFMLDYDVFYVDFDKFSLSMTQTGSEYVISMGTGREKTYFADGFDANMVSSAITDFENKVNAIAQKASQKKELDEQIRVAYDEIINAVSYTLEKDAKPEKVLFVRSSYGALVKGESVCVGYARALKAVLDKLGIDNVIVQGMYVDDNDFNKNGSDLEPHMWNYVRMNDNRWYLVDATMGDGEGINASDYFLKDGTEDVVKYFQPDGVISLSTLSLEFSYPSLSGSEYQRLSLAFTYEEQADETRHISYNGMGLAKAKEAGQYIVCSFDGTNWYYFENYITWVSAVSAPVEIEDYDTYFVELSVLGMAYYGVTDVAPVADIPTSSSGWASFYTCTADIYDISKAGEVIELKKSAPVPVTKTPTNSRLEGDTTYNVTVTYSEPLMLANKVKPAGMKGTNAISEGSNYTNFKWDESNPQVITFTFTTSSTYDYSTGYYFEFVNLVGKESLLAPKPVGFIVVNSPVFGCPKIEGSVSTIYANTPALISDSNLAENDWYDKDGNLISSSLPNRLALVAEPISGSDAEEYENKIEEKIQGDIKGAQTYDLSLTLCSGQVGYISGKKVKIFVPFPAGLNAESGVTFKAYHFKSDGTPEEIECITTEKGIIMMCNAFSTYTVVGVEGEPSEEKKVLVTTFGDGGVYLPNVNDTVELVDLQKDMSQNVIIRAHSGHKIESITLNGSDVEVSNNKEMMISLTYEQLRAAGNTLEVSFVVLTAADEAGIPVYTAPVGIEGLTYNGTEQKLLKEGNAEYGTMYYRLNDGEWSLTVPTAKNAGDYIVWYKIEGDASHTTVGPEKLHVNIAPKEISVTLKGKAEKKYDDNNSVVDMSQLTYDLTGVEVGDIVTVITTDAYATYESVNVGNNIPVTVYDLKLDNTNYVLKSNKVTANIGTITQATLDYIPPHPVNHLVYSGAAQELISAGNISSGGTFEYSLDQSVWSENIPTGKDAGNYTVYYRLVGNSNHQNEAPKAMVVHIAPKTVVVSVSGTVEKEYDGNHDATYFISNIEYSATGLCGGDSVADVVESSHVTADFDDENVGTEKTVTIHNIQIKKNNYVLAEDAQITTKGSIVPKEVTIILTGVAEKTYDKTTVVVDKTALGFELSGLVAGDTSAVSVHRDNMTAEYEDSNAGHNILVTADNLSITGDKANNYKLASTPVAAHIGLIHPKQVKVKVSGSVSKTYDGTIDADISNLNFEVENILSGDVVRVDASYATVVYNSANAGANKEVLVTGLVIDNDNYLADLDGVSAKVGSISKAELTVTVNHATVEEGSEKPEFGVHYAGFVGAEDESVLTGTLSFDCEYTKESNAGEYDIVASGLTSENYKIVFEKGTLTVLAKAIPTPSPTVTPSPSVTPTPSPSVTPTPSPSVTPTPSPTLTPTSSPTLTPTPTPTLTPTVTPVVPNTSDGSNLFVWMCVLLVSSLGIGITCRKRQENIL